MEISFRYHELLWVFFGNKHFNIWRADYPVLLTEIASNEVSFSYSLLAMVDNSAVESSKFTLFTIGTPDCHIRPKFCIFLQSVHAFGNQRLDGFSRTVPMLNSLLYQTTFHLKPHTFY